MADERFTRALARAVARAAVKKARPLVPSRTLRRAMRVVDGDPIVGVAAAAEIPHYWAVYVHDGRRAPFGPRRGAFLIWWRNPAEDPRLPAGQTPRRAAQLRRLSREEFRRALQVRNEALAAGRESPVVITRAVRRPTRATNFFENDGGMAGFDRIASKIAVERFREFALRLLQRELGVTTFVPRGDSVSIKPEEFKTVLVI